MILVLMGLVVSLYLSAQIVEKQMVMSAGEQSGLEADLPVDGKTAEKIWKDYIKPFGKPDWDRRNKEHVLFDVHISSITSGPLTVVAKFNNYGNQTKGAFWFKSGEAFLSADGEVEQIRSAGEFIKEYIYEAERHAIREELKMQDKGLQKLGKEMSKLQKQNQNLHKDIEKAKAQIAKKEREIEENLKSQEDKKLAIETQKEKMQKTSAKLTNVGKPSGE